jgi:hypothetical protein
VTDKHLLNGTLGRKELAKCALCKKGVMHAGVPIFFRVTVERFGVDLRAVEREHGLELLTGSPALANVFSDGRPLASRMDLPGTLTVCMGCATAQVCVGRLEEMTDLAEVRSAAEAVEP